VDRSGVGGQRSEVRGQRSEGRRWALRALIAALVSSGTVAAQPTVAPDARYAELAQQLESMIAHEMRDKEISALSIALVDGQRIVWARGFGWADSARGVAATAETMYRVGSVSKLFTDIAVMQLVERGELSLDADVRRYLPSFNPRNPHGRPVTLRQLMSHRAGVVREPPRGNYFDTSNVSLGETVASLNATALVYAPASTIKYSNAGIAVVGYVLERTRSEPFARYVKRAVLDPLGMRLSAFEPTPEVRARLSRARMWTLHGREFDAPTFELGMAPAGSMYSSVLELGLFIQTLLRGGEPLLRRATLDTMWTPQFDPGARSGIGLGFAVSERDGLKVLGHGGAIYGFATELLVAPEAQVGVIVTASRDVANMVTTRIADVALKQMHRVRSGAAPVAARLTRPIPLALAERAEGRYSNAGASVRLVRYDSTLNLHRGRRAFVRAARDPCRRQRDRRARSFRSCSGSPDSSRAHGDAARTDRRVWLGSQHAVHLRAGRPAARAHRVVLR
jgi:CubicO group peptidase (beta-lactamase class C family)